MKERLSTTADFESVHQLQFIKHSYLRPSRILWHSLEDFGTVSSIHMERLKIWLTHMQFSRSATLPILVYGPTSCAWHWISGSPSFLVYVEKIGEPGDEARFAPSYSKTDTVLSSSGIGALLDIATVLLFWLCMHTTQWAIKMITECEGL